MVARPTRKRMYRTMQGRMIDVERLRAENEQVRAIGNMSVNARGDVLGQGGQIVKPKEAVMREYYEQPKGKVDDRPLKRKPLADRKVVTTPPQPTIQKMTPTQSKPDAPTVVTPEKKGIDAALDGLE